jgi:hypothetical protein
MLKVRVFLTFICSILLRKDIGTALILAADEEVHLSNEEWNRGNMALQNLAEGGYDRMLERGGENVKYFI